MSVTDQDVKDFFGGVEGNQSAGMPGLLPTRARDGAPKDNLWLAEMDEDDVEVRTGGDESKNPGHPYVSYRANIVEPTWAAGRSVFGLFYFPAPVNFDHEPTDAEITEANEKYEAARSRFVGAVDAVLGEGTCTSLQGDTLEDKLEDLCVILRNVSFVGELKFRRAQNGYQPSVQFNTLFHADSWEGEDV